MQRGDFATKICEIATKFSYLVAKLRLYFFVNFERWHACVTPIGDSLRDSYQAPEMQNNALNFEMFMKSKVTKVF